MNEYLLKRVLEEIRSLPNDDLMKIIAEAERQILNRAAFLDKDQPYKSKPNANV